MKIKAILAILLILASLASAKIMKKKFKFDSERTLYRYFDKIMFTNRSGNRIQSNFYLERPSDNMDVIQNPPELTLAIYNQYQWQKRFIDDKQMSCFEKLSYAEW